MVYQDRFIQMDLQIASNGKYWGLGDRAPTQFFLKHGIYTNYNLDSWTPIEDGSTPGKNMYGMHPVLFTRLLGNQWMALFMNNVNAHDWALLEGENPDLPLLASYLTTGGIIDMYVIIGDRISEVVQTYHELIGRPVLVPFYSLGYNQCRWGYTSQTMLEGVFSKARESNFPMETLWADIDYMDRYLDFSVNTAQFPNLTDFVLNTLHPEGVHFVPILDVGIGSRADNNPVYEEGLRRNAFFLSGYTNSTLIGKVWPGSAAFVNLLPNTTGASFWKDQIEAFHSTIPFSGLWLDMEEVSNFCTGECPEDMDFEVIDPVEMFGLKWVPGRRSLHVRSLSANAFVRDTEDNKILEYDLHSLHGFLESYATSEVFTERLKMRPFIISRSTAAGGGRWGSHWLGDNRATWEYMGVSITEIMYFNMYGYPLVGADICGHMGESSLELCGRWMQLGAFYPFMRVHKTIASSPQEPWDLGQEHLKVSREATRLRLSLLRFMYSAYFRVHKEGGALFSPLFFRWEQDDELYNAPEKQFLLGDALLVSPVLEQGASQIEIYFPQPGTWINLATKQIISLQQRDQKIFPVERRSLFVHLTPGRIIPFQHLDANTTQTAELSRLRISLLIALDSAQESSGCLILDDGISLLEDGHYWEIELSFVENELHFAMTEGEDFQYSGEDGLLGEVKLFGFTQVVKKVVVEFKDEKRASYEMEMQASNGGEEIVGLSGERKLRLNEMKLIRFES